MTKTKREGVERFIEKTVNKKGAVFVIAQLGCRKEITSKVNKIKRSMGNPNTLPDPILRMSYQTDLVTHIREETIKKAARIARKHGTDFVVKTLKNEDII